MWMPTISTVTILLGLTPLLQAEEKLVRKVYPVADLVIPIEGTPAWALGKTSGSKAATCQPCTAREKAVDLSEILVNLVAGIQPSSWSDSGGQGTLDYFPLGMGLVVTQTPEVHRQITELLLSLRKLQDVQLEIAMRLVRVPDSFFCERVGVDFNTAGPLGTILYASKASKFGFAEGAMKPVVMTDGQLSSLLELLQSEPESQVLQAPKLTTANGQLATVQIGETRHFVTEVKMKEVDGQKILIPVNKEQFLGSQFAVQGVASADHKSVALKVKAELSELDGPVALHPITTLVTPVFDGGAQGEPIPFTQFLQQPNIRRLVAEEAASIPEGSWLAIRVGRTAARADRCPAHLSDIPYLNRLFNKIDSEPGRATLVLFVASRIKTPEDRSPEGCVRVKENAAGCLTIGGCGAGEEGLSGCITGCGQAVGAAGERCPIKAPCGSTGSSAAQMNLADVVALATSGVGEEIIVNQMFTTGTSFKLCTEDILFLKKHKVSDSLVLTMQNSRLRYEMPGMPIEMNGPAACCPAPCCPGACCPPSPVASWPQPPMQLPMPMYPNLQYHHPAFGPAMLPQPQPVPYAPVAEHLSSLPPWAMPTMPQPVSAMPAHPLMPMYEPPCTAPARPSQPMEVIAPGGSYPVPVYPPQSRNEGPARAPETTPAVALPSSAWERAVQAERAGDFEQAAKLYTRCFHEFVKLNSGPEPMVKCCKAYVRCKNRMNPAETMMESIERLRSTVTMPATPVPAIQSRTDCAEHRFEPTGSTYVPSGTGQYLLNAAVELVTCGAWSVTSTGQFFYNGLPAWTGKDPTMRKKKPLNESDSSEQIDASPNVKTLRGSRTNNRPPTLKIDRIDGSIEP